MDPAGETWMDANAIEEALAKPHGPMVSNVEKKTPSAREVGEALKEVNEAAPEGAATIFLHGLYRFSQTLNACNAMKGRFRFSAEGGDLVWSLYPSNGDAVRYSLRTGAPLVQTLRGALWHTSADYGSRIAICDSAQAILPVSESIASPMRRLWPELSSRIEVVRQGSFWPDLSKALPWKYSGLKRPIHLTVADYSFLMKAAGNIELEEPFWSGEHGTLCIAGSGKHSSQQICGPNVVHLGHVDDIYGAYLGADTFIYNSMQDGVPMALREAMYSGLPVAVRRHPWSGASEIVEHRETGLLYDSIMELDLHLNELPHLKDMGAAAADYVSTELSWQAYGDKMSEIFWRLL